MSESLEPHKVAIVVVVALEAVDPRDANSRAEAAVSRALRRQSDTLIPNQAEMVLTDGQLPVHVKAVGELNGVLREGRHLRIEATRKAEM
jgi:hypothetical protein